MAKRQARGPRHIFLPDCQVKPGVPTDHIAWAARYCADKRPDAIVDGGDFWDMPSLSLYDAGKRQSEGRRVKDDIEAGNEAKALFMRELRRHSPRSYRPRLYYMDGNHDQRIQRAVDSNAKLEGTISLDSRNLKELGWRVSPFLKPTNIDGITYMHYCPLNAQGRVSASQYGAPSALAQARRMMRSTVCGHRQGLDIATVHTPGRTIRSVIAGSFYQHEEEYLTPCGDTYWRGILVFNDVQPSGEFDVCEVSMSYLRRRYG